MSKPKLGQALEIVGNRGSLHVPICMAGWDNTKVHAYSYMHIVGTHASSNERIQGSLPADTRNKKPRRAGPITWMVRRRT